MRSHRIAAVLLALQAFLLGFAGWRDGYTMQEIAALPAGVHHWRTGDLSVFRVNPPLFRLWATWPVALLKPKLEIFNIPYQVHERNDWRMGMDFLRKNSTDGMIYLRVARMMLIPVMLWGAWVCYRWSSELFGLRGGLLSLTLWTFSPWMLGHGHTLAGDTTAGCFALTFGWMFRGWLIHRTTDAAIGVGISLALAILAKTTCLVLVPVALLLWILYGNVRWRSDCKQGSVVIVVMLLLINLSYGFSGTFTTLGSYRFISRELSDAWEHLAKDRLGRVNYEGNRFRDSWLGMIPLPLPKDFVMGIDLQKWDMQRERWSYFCGQWRTVGWWNYYLYGLMVKCPLGSLILGMLMVPWWCCTRTWPGWRELSLLVLPALAILGLVSAETGLNRHVRYVLPALPFLIVCLGGIASGPSESNGFRCSGWLLRTVRALVFTCVCGTIASSLWAYPHSLSYFNELIGGPAQGFRYFEDSNIEWGQDLMYVKRWMDQHPEARPLYVSGYQRLEETILAAGIESAGNPFHLGGLAPSPSGYHWFAINVGRHIFRELPSRLFLDQPIEDRAGYSYHIYRLTMDEFNELRGAHGWQRLKTP
jgi:hypothetical protein